MYFYTGGLIEGGGLYIDDFLCLITPLLHDVNIDKHLWLILIKQENSEKF